MEKSGTRGGTHLGKRHEGHRSSETMVSRNPAQVWFSEAGNSDVFRWFDEVGGGNGNGNLQLWPAENGPNGGVMGLPGKDLKIWDNKRVNNREIKLGKSSLDSGVMGGLFGEVTTTPNVNLCSGAQQIHGFGARNLNLDNSSGIMQSLLGEVSVRNSDMSLNGETLKSLFGECENAPTGSSNGGGGVVVPPGLYGGDTERLSFVGVKGVQCWCGEAGCASIDGTGIQGLFGEIAFVNGADGVENRNRHVEKVGGIQCWCGEAGCASIDGKGIEGLFGEIAFVNGADGLENRNRHLEKVGGDSGTCVQDEEKEKQVTRKMGRPKGSKNKKKNPGVENLVVDQSSKQVDVDEKGGEGDGTLPFKPKRGRLKGSGTKKKTPPSEVVSPDLSVKTTLISNDGKSGTVYVSPKGLENEMIGEESIRANEVPVSVTSRGGSNDLGAGGFIERSGIYEIVLQKDMGSLVKSSKDKEECAVGGEDPELRVGASKDSDLKTPNSLGLNTNPEDKDLQSLLKSSTDVGEQNPALRDLSALMKEETSIVPSNEMQNGGSMQAQSIIYSSKKLQDDLHAAGTKIKQHEDNLKLLKSERNKLEDSILDLQVILGNYHSARPPSGENESHFSNQSEVETAQQILQHETSAAAILCQLTTRHGTHAPQLTFAKDVLGIVATLGKVDDDNLSRLLSEFLGVEKMLGIVCNTYEGVKALETYDTEGHINSDSGIRGFGTSIGRALDCRYLVICLEDLRPYCGEFVADDPQRRLDLLKPKLPNGECPPGFIGFAVNMIHVDYTNLLYVSDAYGLRETLFYNLFSRLQVYKSRKEMLLALPLISDGAISLDGGMIRANGFFSLGNRTDVDVRFPKLSMSPNTSDSCMETENQLKQKAWEKEKLMEDIKREQSLLNSAKYNFERKKEEFVKFLAQSSA